MDITETFTASVVEATPADGRWLQFDCSPTTNVTANLTGRALELDVTALRRVRAIVNHLLTAEEVTAASVAAAITAEFA